MNAPKNVCFFHPHRLPEKQNTQPLTQQMSAVYLGLKFSALQKLA